MSAPVANLISPLSAHNRQLYKEDQINAKPKLILGWEIKGQKIDKKRLQNCKEWKQIDVHILFKSEYLKI